MWGTTTGKEREPPGKERERKSTCHFEVKAVHEMRPIQSLRGDA